MGSLPEITTEGRRIERNSKIDRAAIACERPIEGHTVT